MLVSGGGGGGASTSEAYKAMVQAVSALRTTIEDMRGRDEREFARGLSLAKSAWDCPNADQFSGEVERVKTLCDDIWDEIETFRLANITGYATVPTKMISMSGTWKELEETSSTVGKQMSGLTVDQWQSKAAEMYRLVLSSQKSASEEFAQITANTSRVYKAVAELHDCIFSIIELTYEYVEGKILAQCGAERSASEIENGLFNNSYSNVLYMERTGLIIGWLRGLLESLKQLLSSTTLSGYSRTLAQLISEIIYNTQVLNSNGRWIEVSAKIAKTIAALNFDPSTLRIQENIVPDSAPEDQDQVAVGLMPGEGEKGVDMQRWWDIREARGGTVDPEA